MNSHDGPLKARDIKVTVDNIHLNMKVTFSENWRNFHTEKEFNRWKQPDTSEWKGIVVAYTNEGEKLFSYEDESGYEHEDFNACWALVRWDFMKQYMYPIGAKGPFSKRIIGRKMTLPIDKDKKVNHGTEAVYALSTEVTEAMAPDL